MSAWVEHDSRADALTVNFSTDDVARTIEAGGGRLVDLSASGRVIRIEILGVSGGFALADLVSEYGLADAFREVEGSLPAQFYRHYAA